MAMVASMCLVTFTACGGSDDDDIGGESGNLTVGTHRVDVEFSGETAGWNVSLTFLGTDKNVTKASRLYENGSALTTVDGVWLATEFRPYSVTTDNDSQSLQCTVTLRKKYAGASPVTVTLKGYVNGKQVKMRAVTTDASHKGKMIAFYSQISEDFENDIDY